VCHDLSSRANGQSRAQALQVAVVMEEARLKGERVPEYVQRTLNLTAATAGRRMKAAREELAKEPELLPAIERLARERLAVPPTQVVNG